METSKDRQRRKSLPALCAFAGVLLMSWTRTLVGDACFATAVLARRRPCPATSLTAKAADMDFALSEDWEGDEDVEALEIPKLRRSSLKLKGMEKPPALDVDVVTAFVREELGNTVFKASEAEIVDAKDDQINLQSAAAILQQWALRREPPDAKKELLTSIEMALRDGDLPEPHTLVSLMWSCGRLKVDDIAPLLTPIQELLPKVAHSMNAQNLTTFWCSVAKIQELAEEVDDMIPILLDAIEEKADDLQPNQLAAFIWASGKLDLKKSEVERIKAHFPQRLSRDDMQLLPPKDLANFAFGLAQLDFRDSAMLNTIAATTAEMAEASKQKSALQDLPMIVMSLTRLGFKEKGMNILLDAVASRLQRKRMLRKMPAWSLAALYWAWPSDGLEGVRDMQEVLRPEVEKRIAKNEFSHRMLERSWMGPKEWRRRIDTSVKIPA